MNVVSSYRKKLEPKRRFGSREFQTKIKSASNYKRIFNANPRRLWRWVVGAVLLAGFYFMVLSHYFLISEIQVSGNTQVATETIQEAIRHGTDSRVFLVRRDNFFLLSGGRVNRVLTQALPDIKAVVNFKRSWPNKILIEVKERMPGFVIQSQNNYFLIDDDGTMVRQLEQPEQYLVVEDQAQEDFSRGEILPNAKFAPFVVSMNNQWGSKINTPIVAAKFPAKASTDVQFITQEGWSVLFDTTRSVLVQLTNLNVLLNKQIGARRPQLAYIDLRLSKAYFCYKSSPCEAEPSKPAEEGTTNAQ